MTKVRKSQILLGEINMITKRLQSKGSTLSACRSDVEHLQYKIEKASQKPGWKLHNCKLGNEYIRVDSHLTTDASFEKGIVKLQEGEGNQLTDSEKLAVQILKNTQLVKVQESESEEDAPIAESLKKRRKLDQNEQYVCADFVLGSFAEVERIWSAAKHVLSDERNSLKPLLFGALMFHEYNARLWGDERVAEAVRCAVSERSQKRLSEIEQQVEFDVDFSNEE